MEATEHEQATFYLGVNWHPERTPDPNTGTRVMAALTRAALQRLLARRDRAFD